MKKELQAHLKWAGGCQVGKRIYFVNMTFNGLFYLDTEDLSTHFVHTFSVGQKDANTLSTIGCYYDGSVYFFTAGYVMRYDLSDRKEDIIPVIGNRGEPFEPYDIIRYGHLVYLFPSDLCKGIYVLDLQKQTVEKDKELSLLFQDSFPFWCNILIGADGRALIGMYEGSRLVEIDLIKKRIVYTKDFGETVKILSVFYGKGMYWITQTWSTDIYAWDKENDILQVYKNENPIWEEKILGEMKMHMPYANMVFLEDEIIVLNAHLKNPLRIDMEQKTVGDPILFPNDFCLTSRPFRGNSICCGFLVLERTVLLYPLHGNMLLVYDKATHELSGKEMLVSEREVPYLADIFRDEFMKKKFYVETQDSMSLEEFLIMVTLCTDIEVSSEQMDTGQMIYQEGKR